MSAPSTSVIISYYCHQLSTLNMVALPIFSNYKEGAVWLSLRSMLGHARVTREGERRKRLLFSHRASSTFLLSPPSKWRLLRSHDWLR